MSLNTNDNDSVAPRRGPSPGALLFALLLVGAGAVLVFVIRPWAGKGREDVGPSLAKTKPPPSAEPTEMEAPTPKEVLPPPRKKGSFLEDFGKEDGHSEGKKDLTNAELESKLGEMIKARDRLRDIRDRAMREKLAGPLLKAAIKEHTDLEARLDRDLAVFQDEVKAARSTRPKDPVPEWITGELLIFIGGEPEIILPYLDGALKKGLDRPRLLASKARTLIEANRFDEAYEVAHQAVRKDGKDEYVFNAFKQAAEATERYEKIIDELNEAFPKDLPDWARKTMGRAEEGFIRLQMELKARGADAKADNNPRVRLLVEHRRFKRDAKGAFLKGEIESTGKGEVLLELFEDVAPNTVANFLSLVEAKKFDNTRFYLAQAATLVAGGDFEAKDAESDGTGTPGYFIPDEMKRDGARKHFRGSLCMVKNPSAGSQFFINLIPEPRMDGHFTVFGRVLKGMDVLDRMTPGRTNYNVGHFGNLVPGDLLLHAAVLRKRGHEYKVTKLPLE
ncbi:MAG: peptidylprolyl isomerase [Gemmataceae bacterium]